MSLTHRRAVAMMVLVTFLWSLAGVVSRHLEAAASFEVTFWRSLFNALAMTLALSVLRGAALWRGIARARWPFWVSGLCWAGMYTAFMVAITLTSVANVLVTMAVGPLLTAVFSRVFLHHRLPSATWAAIGVAGLGIAWMFGREAAAGVSLTGTAVALLVPLAAATNWTILQHIGHGSGDPDEAPADDMLPAALVGAVLSAAITAPLAWPFQASLHDLGLLAFLGVFQLAVPCLLVVGLTRALPAPEIALLGLLEVLFGIALTWLGAGERPAAATLQGGLLVLAALVGNELLALQRRRRDGVAGAGGPTL